MSKTLTAVNTSIDTFQIWVNRTNEVISTLATECLTANSSVSGALTVGNIHLAGIFSSATLTANGVLRGGNVSHSNTLWIGSNTTVNDFSFSVANSSSNVIISPTSISLSNSGILTSALLSYGNSTVNAVIYANGLIQSKNSSINVGLSTSGLVLSNSTAENIISINNISYGNSSVNSSFSVNSIQVSNSTVSAALSLGILSIGNSTVNSTANSTLIESQSLLAVTANVTSLYSELFSTNNSTVNTSILIGANVLANTTSFSVGNTITNSVLSMLSLKVGNSTVNAVVNSTAIVFSNTTGNYQITADLISGNTFSTRYYFSSFSTLNTSPLLIDSFDKTFIRAVEYNLSVKQSNGICLFSKLNVQNFDSDTEASYNEYARMQSNASANVGNFSANANSTHVLLYFTPLTNITSGQFSRLNLGV